MREGLNFNVPFGFDSRLGWRCCRRVGAYEQQQCDDEDDHLNVDRTTDSIDNNKQAAAYNLEYHNVIKCYWDILSQ